MVVLDVPHIFDVFGGPRGLLETLTRYQPDHGLAYNTVQMWNARQQIPAKYVGAVLYCWGREGHPWSALLIDGGRMLGL
jgi:hypothetical protein